jgi:anti-sigma B factor antagonist
MTEPLVSIESEQLNGRTVVRLTGQIDLSNIHQLEQQVGWAIEGSPNVVIDLAGIEYLDSQGLRLFKQLSDKAQKSGCEFAVLAPSDTFVRQVFEMSRLDEYVTVRDTLDA